MRKLPAQVEPPTKAAVLKHGPPDEFVPDPVAFQELSITSMTGWRWDRDPALIALGWPPPIKIRRRNFRSRRQLELFKQTLIAKSVAERGRGAA